MADACPKGGDHVWISDEKHGNQFFCRKCGQTKSKDGEEKKRHIPFSLWVFIGFLIEFGIFLVVYFATPVPNVINAGWQSLANIIPASLLSILENPYIIAGTIVLLSGIVIFNALIVYHLDFGRLNGELQKLFFVVDFVFVAIYLIWLGIESSSALDPYICSYAVGSGVTFAQFFPGLSQRCAQYQQSQLPSYTKTGTHTPLSIAFGIQQSDGTFFVQGIYQNNYFSLPVNLKDADTTQSLNGIAAIGYDKNDTCTPGDDCLELLSNTCSQGNPCKLGIGQSLGIVMKTQQVIQDKVYSTPTFPILFEYPQTAYGESDLAVVRSFNDVQISETLQPQSSTGPLDVIIFFAPSMYIEGTSSSGAAIPVPINPTSSTDVTMYVAVSNFGIGYGQLQNITIQRVGSYSEIDKVQCSAPTTQSQTFSEGQAVNLNGMIVPRQGNVQFSCDIKMNDDIAKALLNNNQAPSQNIPFIANVNYNYYETYTYTPNYPSYVQPGTSITQTSPSPTQ